MTTKNMSCICLLCTLFSTLSNAQDIELSSTELTNAYKTTSRSWTSVHDPSVVIRPGSIDYYFVFGSHMAVSRSTDLIRWTYMYNENVNSTLFGKISSNGSVVKCSYNEAFRINQTDSVNILSANDTIKVGFGRFDASAWNTCIDNNTVAGNMWAPDVVYNPSLKKWCMYLSLNGPKWNSSIILLTASAINGPYVYQGPVVYSGFNVTSNAGTSYQLTDIELALGKLSSLPSRYKVGNSWGTNWPHCIDPCVFYDDKEQLWLIYGSWSGGIYALQLDENTGLRDYTVTYPIVGNGGGVTSDPYFGKKIAGGYYVSGEGPYIQKIGNYYFLFMSYGFFSPDGGYEMRIFRSSNPDGPYKDASGTSAIYTSYQMNYGPKAATNRGMKLFGSYQWDLMNVAEIAQGHNSALVDNKGNAYVVYHTKFNDGTVGHQVRVHQLFLNDRSWIVAAPYEYSGEKWNQDSIAQKQCADSSEIIGEYQVMLHPYKMNYEKYAYSTPKLMQLNADGSITGAYSGRWTLTEGTSYIYLVLSGVTYYGCLIEQTIDLTNIKALCITAMNGNGVALWASKADSKAVVAMNYIKLTPSFSNGSLLSKNLSLPTSSLLGGKTTWQSSNEEILSNNGIFTVPQKDTTVCLTAIISHGRYFAKKEYTFNVKGKPDALSSTTIKTTPAEIYNILGRRVEKPLPQGFYIVNGEKVYIKE